MGSLLEPFSVHDAIQGRPVRKTSDFGRVWLQECGRGFGLTGPSYLWEGGPKKKAQSDLTGLTGRVVFRPFKKKAKSSQPRPVKLV